MLKRIYPDPSTDPDAPIDAEIEDLVYAINALPGIETTSSCFGHGKQPVQIFFGLAKARGDVRNVGLFFLTRCIDRRYSDGKWGISLSVGDRMENDLLPTTFLLKSKDKGKEALAAIKRLMDNLELHLNHKNFMEGYKINRHDFFIDGERSAWNPLA